MKATITAVILAGGQGKRMRSRRNKVLFPLAGRCLLQYPIRAAQAAGVDSHIVVVSPTTQAEIGAYLAREVPTARIAVQMQARGTGDAVKAASGALHTELTLILCGDAPLVTEREIAALVTEYESHSEARLVVLSCELAEPFGYGRLIRASSGGVVAIREQKELKGQVELGLSEVNAGAYLVSTQLLQEALEDLRADNSQGEYYLTDMVAFAARQGPGRVFAVRGDPDSVLGVNDREQLAKVAQVMGDRIRRRHRLAGVSVHQSVELDDTVELAVDVELRANVSLRGATRVGAGTVVDVGAVISDAQLGENVFVKPYSVVSGSRVGADVQLGPFAHLRPGTVLDDEVHVGNFVETKKTRLRRGAKANHLAYLGDGDVGEGANLGAGTIFCNYDGVSKWKTEIGARAFIGSDSQLVAPVRVGAGAIVASGTTVTNDVPDDAFAISRSRQVTKEGYAPSLRERFSQQATSKKSC